MFSGGLLRSARQSLGNVHATRRRTIEKTEYYLPCMWSVIIASIIGTLIIGGGVALCVAGYQSEKHMALFINQTALLNSTVLVNDWETFVLPTHELTFIGPICMSIGCFIIIISCVILFETRDKAIKIKHKFGLVEWPRPDFNKLVLHQYMERRDTFIEQLNEKLRQQIEKEKSAQRKSRKRSCLCCAQCSSDDQEDDTSFTVPENKPQFVSTQEVGSSTQWDETPCLADTHINTVQSMIVGPSRSASAPCISEIVVICRSKAHGENNLLNETEDDNNSNSQQKDKLLKIIQSHQQNEQTVLHNGDELTDERC